MNSWSKHVFTTVLAMPFLTCNVPQNSGRIHHKKHRLDSLPTTIIKPSIYRRDSVLSIDTTSGIPENNPVPFNGNLEFKGKGSANFNAVSNSFLNIRHLPDMNFPDKELAVVDFGNINYLNQEF